METFPLSLELYPAVREISELRVVIANILLSFDITVELREVFLFEIVV